MTTERIANYPPLIWWWVSLPSTTFVIATRNDWVRRVPGIALPLLGRPWPPNAEYLRRQGAIIRRIGETHPNGRPNGTRDRVA